MDYIAFDRNRLVDTLTSVKPGLAKKDIIDQASKFAFKDGSVYTYNDEIAISHPLEYPLVGVVPSIEFYTLLSKMKTDMVNIAIDGTLLHVKGGKLEATFNIEDEVKLPISDLSSPSLWYDLPTNFLEAVDLALSSAGTDLSKPVLTCIHWTSNYMESCDNFRLTRYILDTPGLADSTLLSNRTAVHLKNYNPKQFAIEKGWAHFKTDDDCIFSCKVYGGDYVNLDSIFNKTHDKELTFTDATIELLDRVSILAEKDIHGNSKALITIDKGVATIHATSSIGEITESTRIRCKEDISFEFKIETLLKILQRLKVAKIDPDKKSLSFSNTTWTHIISLC